MFKVEFIVHDKHLADVLRPLAGKAMDLQVVPVVNAVAKPDGPGRQPKVAPIIEGNFVELMVAELRKRHPEKFHGTEARAVVEALGRSGHSYGYYLIEAVNQGFLRRIARDGTRTIFGYPLKQLKHQPKSLNEVSDDSEARTRLKSKIGVE